RLPDEGVERLLRPAAHEGGELVDVLGLRGVKLRREAERKDPLDDHFLDAAETLGDGLPVSDDDLQKWIAFRPARVNRERLDALRIFAGEPKRSGPAQRHAAHVRPLDADRL